MHLSVCGVFNIANKQLKVLPFQEIEKTTKTFLKWLFQIFWFGSPCRTTTDFYIEGFKLKSHCTGEDTTLYQNMPGGICWILTCGSVRRILVNFKWGGSLFPQNCLIHNRVSNYVVAVSYSWRKTWTAFALQRSNQVYLSFAQLLQWRQPVYNVVNNGEPSTDVLRKRPSPPPSRVLLHFLIH